MSQENVEIVRRLYDAYLSGDFEAPSLAVIDPEVDLGRVDGPPGRPGLPRTRRSGRGAPDLDGNVEAFRLDVEEIIDGGDQVVVVEKTFGARQGEAGCHLRSTTFPSSRCATAPSPGRSSSGLVRRPSKPPDCRSSSRPALLQR